MSRTQQYLSRYAEPEAELAAQLFSLHPRPTYRRVVVIPAFDESTGFVRRLLGHPHIQGALVIVVVNRPCTAALNAAGQRTQALWSELRTLGEPLQQQEHLLLLQCASAGGHADVLLVDYCMASRCLSPRHGVGLARKIACDIAVQLYFMARISQPWIYCTDADAWLPDNYFAQRPEAADVAAIQCAFCHFHPHTSSVAQNLYDLSLHYFVGGLRYAHSPYSHYSLGSVLIISMEHYAMVRGFPKRPAGEDFYVLNKLAKTGRIVMDTAIVIKLLERESTRIPFGTGPAIRKIARLETPETELPFYHPRGFELLKLWLAAADLAPGCRNRIAALGAKSWLQRRWKNQPHRDVLIAALDALNMLDYLDHALQEHRLERQFHHQFRITFDALKTLRLIHTLRDGGLGTVDAATASAWMATVGLRQPF